MIGADARIAHACSTAKQNDYRETSLKAGFVTFQSLDCTVTLHWSTPIDLETRNQ